RVLSSVLSSLLGPPPRPTLFPYTTLFRSFTPSALRRTTTSGARKPMTSKSWRSCGVSHTWPCCASRASRLPGSALISASREALRSEEHPPEPPPPPHLLSPLPLQNKTPLP